MTQAYRVKITRFELAPPRGGIKGYWLNFVCVNKSAFQDAVEAVKALPLAYRAWDTAATGKAAWWVAGAVVGELAEEITDLDVYRSIWRKNAGRRAEQEPPPRSRDTPPPPRASFLPAEVQAAFDTLHLQATAPAEVVKAVHRALAKMYHPDAGGDMAAMKKVNAAADRVLAWIEPAAAKRSA